MSTEHMRVDERGATRRQVGRAVVITDPRGGVCCVEYTSLFDAEMSVRRFIPASELIERGLVTADGKPGRNWPAA